MEDANAQNSEKLIVLAKQHLGYPLHSPAAAIPKSYLHELKTHLILYPYDTKFRVFFSFQNVGFGHVTCLEDGCIGEAIRLKANTTSKDGGRQEGFGSLAEYRVHIVNHKTHAKMRLIRVKAEQAAQKMGSRQLASSSKMVKSEPIPHVDLSSVPRRHSDLNVHPSTVVKQESKGVDLLSRLDASFGSSGGSRVKHEGRVKPEPVESTIPRKRVSDSAFLLAGDKNEVKPVHRAGSFGAPPNPVSKKPKLENIKTPLTQVNENKVNVNQAPVPAMSVDAARQRLAVVQVLMSGQQSSLDRLNRKVHKSKRDVRNAISMEKEIVRLRAQKDALSSAIPNTSPLRRLPSASGSNVQLPPAYNANDLPAFPHDQKPFVNRLPPVTSSGSASCLPNIESPPMDNRMAVDQHLPNIMAPIMSLPDDHIDDNGDYHGRGRDLFAGPQAKADDIDKFLLAAGNAAQFDGNATVDEALAKLGLDEQYQLLPGMEVALMAHQTIGVAWMLQKEKDKAHLGGCLSDEMGLGKTVQMIAVMVTNASTDPKCKTNLIIAPTALLDQWKLEIEMKTNNDFKCLIYHGSGKVRTKKDLLKYDVVLTTYQTMALEWPDAEAEHKAKAKKKKNPADNFIETDSDDDAQTKRKRKDAGLLFQVDFFRVVLDEAQNIRNRRTRNSRAVTELKTTYRWCLTGTPIINGLTDAYAIIRFLRVRPWYDWTEFNSHISRLERKNPNLAVTRLQAILAHCNFRRMKDSMLDGKKLIDLPPKNITLTKLEFDEEERDIYKMVEARSQATFNRFRRAGTVLKNYTQVLVLLLRLRQICGHPSLIQEDGVSYIAPDELDNEDHGSEELTRARQLVSSAFVSKMKEKLKDSALRRVAAEKESQDATVDDEECPICFDIFTDPVVTPCCHIFCRECLTHVLNSPHLEDGNADVRLKPDERPCPSCRSTICKEKLFSRKIFEPTDAELVKGEERPADINMDDSDVEMVDASEISKPLKGKGKGKGKAKKTKKRFGRSRVLDSSEEDSEEDEANDSDMSDFIVQSDEDEEEKDARRKMKTRLGKRRAIVVDSDSDDADEGVIYGAKKEAVLEDQIKLMPRFLPSTKMKHMIELLRTWNTEHPDEKTLIVSQWTQCLQLVSDYLTEQDVLHVKYQGDMDRKKRDKAVRVFMAKDKAQVMLMSLKCGGVGLNLTRANRVISLDLGWSQAIESQAFDRVHRLGQQRDVFVHRLVIANTVEDRVLALQERKQNLADGSLGEGKAKKIGRMSVRELANLFGLDHRGRVLADD